MTENAIELRPLAIIAGRGDLPKMIIKKCQEINRPFVVLLIEGEASNGEFLQYHHHIVHIGYISRVLQILRAEKIAEIVMAGGISKPSMANIKVDGKGAILLSKIIGARLFGDDNVLSAVINFFEKEGYRIVGPEKIIDDLLVSKGILTACKPNADFLKDIELAKKALQIISELDVGQGVVVQQNQILGIEGVEGTDALIERCGALQMKIGRSAVLVKMKKINQNTKVDLPSLGVKTIENLYRAGFAGMAAQAGSSLIINQKEVVRLANQYGLFLIGF